MFDQAGEAGADSARDVIERLTRPFAHLSDAALARITGGGAAGYVTPDLARALLDARGHLGQDMATASAV